MTSQRTRDYELVMILSPEATEAEAAQTVQRITEIISDGGGSISQQENWGIRRLAYPIQRFIEGNYFITRCQMEAQAAVELDKTLNATQDVMRHLVFRLEESEIAAMEAQAERQRQELARQEAEARAAAAREAREREEAAARIAAEREARERAEAEAQAPTAEAEDAPAETEAEIQEPVAEAENASAETETEAPAVATAEVETSEDEQAVQEPV
ncbi:MAG: 30S ribosomal protein S6 [Dehalococcoidia bacterium]|nr:30S ribosomal protein S6 [Dehalococcoidia bacterium]